MIDLYKIIIIKILQFAANSNINEPLNNLNMFTDINT
jgi:hypothetical protein